MIEGLIATWVIGAIIVTYISLVLYAERSTKNDKFSKYFVAVIFWPVSFLVFILLGVVEWLKEIKVKND